MKEKKMQEFRAATLAEMLVVIVVSGNYVQELLITDRILC